VLIRASPNPVVPVTTPAKSAARSATRSAQLNKAEPLPQNLKPEA
jgi:hypothetical protein